MENNVYACIDIGSHEIKLLVCHLREERLFVLSRKTIKSMGIERGQIINFDKLVGQIKKVKELAELDLKQSLKNLILTISPIDALVEPVMGRIYLDVKQPVDSQNIRQLFHQVMEQPHEEEAYVPIGLIPRLFRIDENQIVQNPRGLSGMSLGIEAQRVLLPATVISNLVHTVESSGFKVEEIVVGSISETFLALMTPEMFAKTCHINVGHDLTTLTIINDGKILHARTLFIGGHDITRAIAEKFKISEELAGELKINYGKILIREADLVDNQVIHIDDAQEAVKFITRGMLNEVVTEETIKLFRAIKDHIVEDLRLKEEEYHYSLAGGMAELPNIIYALQNQFATQNQLPMPASIYRPTMLGVRDSKFTSLVGVAIFIHELNLLLGSPTLEKDLVFHVEKKEKPDVQASDMPALKDIIPLNEKVLPSSVSKDPEKPQSLKDAIASTQGSKKSTDVRTDTIKEIPITEKSDDFFPHDIELSEVTDDYIDEKLGNSGVFVRFLDKIFNENEEET